MLALILTALFVVAPQAPSPSATLPDTPQGKHVAAFVKAFNSGDEKTFMAAQQELLTPRLLSRQKPEEQAKMFQRMKGDFGTMKIAKVVKADGKTIEIIVPTGGGQDAIFTFTFEEAAPFRINGIQVEVS